MSVSDKMNPKTDTGCISKFTARAENLQFILRIQLYYTIYSTGNFGT